MYEGITSQELINVYFDLDFVALCIRRRRPNISGRVLSCRCAHVDIDMSNHWNVQTVTVNDVAMQYMNPCVELLITS